MHPLRPRVALLMAGGAGPVTRLNVTVDGNEWRVHGHQGPVLWHPHLVELVGNLDPTVVVDWSMAQKVKAAVSQAMGGARIGRLPTELMLVTGYKADDC